MGDNTASGAANRQSFKYSDMFRYFSESCPSFIVLLEREEYLLREVKLPDNFINGLKERIPSNVTIVLANGHETHVNFKRTEQSLYHMTEFNKDCRGLFGSIMIYSYKGSGKFFVNCLKDDLCEVIYFKNRTIARGTFYDQDLVTGIGWKFLVYLNNPAISAGEIPVPAHFWRSFGKLLPATLNFYMRNGNRYEGTCSLPERRFYGLQDLIKDYGLSENEKILFTYCGGGNFLVMIFDISNVEAMLVDTETDSSEEDNDSAQEQNADNMPDDLENAMQNENQAFTHIMTASNVDNTSHGVYIPPNIQRANKQWIAGEYVTLRCGMHDWIVRLVISNKLPRFSSGWNRFARENQLTLNEPVDFTMLEADGTTIFNITFPQRP